MPIVLEGLVSAVQRAESPFVQLPLEVPAGITRIDVSYQADAGSILDIGLADPRLGPFPSRAGFRGWSGSARSSFFVATDAATPGYLPGEMPPGRWQIILGLAKVAAMGCRYRIELTLDDTPRTLIEPSKPVPTSRAESGWYRGDLQSHSHHSDAKGSLEDLVAAAEARGLDFLAVTDHNTVSHHRRLADLSTTRLLLLPGEELTTYRGHANVWGAAGWLDFRLEEGGDLDRLVQEVHARGGLFSVNHPKRHENCIGCDWEYPVPVGADCLEAWQGPWPYRNWESLARYDALLRQGRRITLVGGSDRHQPGWPDSDPAFLQLGSPTTWLELRALSVPALLQGLRAGRAFVSESPAGPRLELSLNDTPMGGVLRVRQGDHVSARAATQGARGDLLCWVGAGGRLREVEITDDTFTDAWDWPADGPFLRAEIVAQGNDAQLAEALELLERLNRLPHGLHVKEMLRQPRVRALSNPVYLEGR